MASLAEKITNTSYRFYYTDSKETRVINFNSQEDFMFLANAMVHEYQRGKLEGTEILKRKIKSL